MQLRNEKPEISGAGTWSFFGGAIENGERPEDAVLREIEEELAIRPKQCTLLWIEDSRSDFHRAMAAPLAV